MAVSRRIKKEREAGTGKGSYKKVLENEFSTTFSKLS